MPYKFVCIKADVEMWASSRGLSTKSGSFQILVKLPRNQPLVKKALIAAHLVMQRGLCQKTYFEFGEIAWIMLTQCIQRIFDGLAAARNGLMRRSGDLFAEKL